MATQQLQRDQDVVAYTAFNGLRSDVTPERFDLGDLTVGDNIDIDKSGRITRRAGYASLFAQASHSLWSDQLQEMCFRVRAQALYRIMPDWSEVFVTSLASNARMSYERVGNRVYYSNGQDVGVYENGAARSWGLPQAPAPDASATSGSMPAGTYQFTMTWLRGDGQESGAALCGQITLGYNSGIVFALPVSAHPDVVGKVLYLSPPNAEVPFEAVAMNNAQTSLTWTSDPSALSYPLKTQFRQPAPAGQLVAFFRGQMLVAAEDTLYISDAYAYERFNLRRYVQLDGRITLLAPFDAKDRNDGPSRESGIFIGTDRSTGIIAGTDTDAWQYVAKAEYGAVFGAMDYVDGALFHKGEAGVQRLPMWLSTQGVCVGMPDLMINNLTRSTFTFPATGQGAALFMPTVNRFIATANL